MSDTRTDSPSSRQSSTSSPSSTSQPPSSSGSAQLVSTQGAEATQVDSGHGKTIIADSVVAKIAAVAAREIDGVHDLVPMGAGATIAGLAGRVARTEQRATGVSVEVGQREAAVDLNMTVEYGVNILQVAEAVRQNITERIQAMTGLIVKEVNINAADLYFPKEEAEPARVQ